LFAQNPHPGGTFKTYWMIADSKRVDIHISEANHAQIVGIAGIALIPFRHDRWISLKGCPKGVNWKSMSIF